LAGGRTPCRLGDRRFLADGAKRARITGVSVLAVVLIACAVLLVIGAEWPRLTSKARTGAEARPRRRRSRSKPQLHVIQGDSEDFAESVRRDLDRLPVIEERDDRRP
jgi:hypothetical protein